MAMLYRQVQFIQARVDAYEAILSNPLNVLRGIFRRKWLKQRVGELQLALIQKHDAELKQAVEVVKAEKMKPKLTVVGANGIPKLALVLVAALAFSGCVTKRVYKADVEKARTEGYEKANRECLALQQKIAIYVTSLQDRLRKFNQLNEDNSLRTKKNDDSKSWNANQGANDEN